MIRFNLIQSTSLQLINNYGLAYRLIGQCNVVVVRDDGVVDARHDCNDIVLQSAQTQIISSFSELQNDCNTTVAAKEMLPCPGWIVVSFQDDLCLCLCVVKHVTMMIFGDGIRKSRSLFETRKSWDCLSRPFCFKGLQTPNNLHSDSTSLHSEEKK